MRITVKVKPESNKDPAAVVRDRVNTVQKNAEIEKVFPGVRSGHRAGLVVVNLPENADCEAVLRSLRDEIDIEYAQPASPRKAR